MNGLNDGRPSIEVGVTSIGRAAAWSCTTSRARVVSEGHEKTLDLRAVMGDLPLSLGTVVSQYLDQIGIRDQLLAIGSSHHPVSKGPFFGRDSSHICRARSEAAIATVIVGSAPVTLHLENGRVLLRQ